MQKWQSITMMVLTGVVPVAVAIVALQQFEIVGLNTALLLGLLYLLFVSTHVWCRIFTKAPPTHLEQVDSLPCYEEAVKSDPPSYSSLYPENAASRDVTTPSLVASTIPVVTSKPVSQSGTHQSSQYESDAISFNPVPSETPDDLPILGRLFNKDSRRNSRPVLVVPAQATEVRPVSSGSMHQSYETPSASPGGEEERTVKKEKIYSRMLENIANPIDYVYL